MQKYICLVIVSGLFLLSCATSPDPATLRGDMFKSYKDYPDHVFNVNEYVKGMKKGDHNLLIWRDTLADLSKYKSVNITYFDGRLLPDQKDVSYLPYIKEFNKNFSQSFKIRKNDKRGLRVEGAIVECNLGRPNVKAMFRTGEDKTYGGVVCEIYEPGSSIPVIRMFTRDTATGGAMADDSNALMNHIFQRTANRLSKNIELQIGQ